MLSIASIAARVFTLLVSIVVLGLSVSLAKQQYVGSPPSETSFGGFAGAFGIIVSVIGLVSIWVDKISPLIVMGADALASIFFLAGGIAMTIAMKSVSSCTDKSAKVASERFNNKIINGGCVVDDGVTYCYGGDQEDAFPLTIGRCQRAQADYVMEFIAFIFGLGLIVLGWLAHKRGGTSTRSYV
ncbi:putative MARVEL domain-containing protein [Seiridium cardinale]|uniref:MARVEL domain-containing protein n=1 Tax=Seiridium cardinale TaxID=138064 RepID=A0ABR2Y6G0_9PEZI